MGPKQQITDDLIIALRDQRVLDALASVFETKLQSVVTELKLVNERQATQITKLQSDLQSAASRIEALEQYTRRDNLLITGMPIETYAESASTEGPGETSLREEHSKSVEVSVLKLFNDQLGVQIKSSDISIAHRLKKRANVPGPPTTIVRFTNRKAREAVYNARRKLRNEPTRVFINEDLNRSTADLFRQARQLVRSRRIHSTWTSSCAVYIKETNELNCRPKKISSVADLPAQ
jgi:hypothetical protein